MKNKEELFSPVYGCVSFNEKEEIKREDFDPKVLEDMTNSWYFIGVPKLSGHFPVDEKELLSFYKLLRSTYEIGIVKNKQLIQMHESIDYSSYSTKHPFEKEIEGWKRDIENLTKMIDSLDKVIEKLEKKEESE